MKHQALQNWLKDGDKMQHPCLDNYMMMAGHRKLLETALKNQAKLVGITRSGVT
jgi:hypothetical protein